MNVKKMMTCSVIAMMAGAGMMAYCLTNKETKKNATKILDDVLTKIKTK